MVKTVKCKLIVDEAQRLALLETMRRFAAACIEIADLARRQNIWHKFALQALYYHYLRQHYGLKANYCVRVFDRVAASRGGAFTALSLIIDARLFRYIEKVSVATIATLDERLRVPLAIGEYQRSLLRGWTLGAGTITYDRRTRTFFANLCVNIEPPVPAGSKPLGVDLGINRVATTSTGLILSGREVNRKREKFARVRASLQSRGTKGSKRVLKRLGGREARFQNNTNHNISKRLVRLAKDSDSYLVLEDLKGIRKRTAGHGKHHRRRMGRWAFYQLRTFISYKAEEAGVRVVFVDPRHTSKRCGKCGELGTRTKHRFVCSCGHAGDADVLAAINIAAKGALPIAPEVAVV